jgi:hypothetical protein
MYMLVTNVYYILIFELQMDRQQIVLHRPMQLFPPLLLLREMVLTGASDLLNSKALSSNDIALRNLGLTT